MEVKRDGNTANAEIAAAIGPPKIPAIMRINTEMDNAGI